MNHLLSRQVCSVGKFGLIFIEQLFFSKVTVFFKKNSDMPEVYDLVLFRYHLITFLMNNMNFLN